MRLRLVAAICGTVILGSYLIAGRVEAGPIRANPGTPFCDAPSRNPSLRLLSQLPSLREPPRYGRLPLLPAIRLTPLTPSLVPVGEVIGLVVSERKTDGREVRPSTIRVIGVISTVDSSGEVRKEVRHVAEEMKKGLRIPVTYRTGQHPDTYRVDVFFERRSSGHRLAHYAKYFRAAQPRVEAQVALSRDAIRAGGTLYARMENVGVLRITTGYGYRIERFSGSQWEVDPNLQDDRTVPRVAVKLPAGGTFECVRLPIPTDQPTGRYRIVKEVAEPDGSRRIAIGKFSVIS